MDKGMYLQLPQIEEKHWWFISRRLLVEEVLKKAGFKKGKNALDLGCGTGGNLPFLKKFCPQVYGIDFSKLALKIARKKWSTYKFIYGDINKLEKFFPSNNFDLVTIFNVLYHQWVKSETKVIEQIFKLLKPGGYLLLTEPAFDFLFRNHDLLDMGRKRYTLGEFKKILENSGFQIVKATYFNSICFIPALLLKLIESLKPPKKQHFGANELNIPSPLINKMFLTIISWERQIINLLVSLPFGVTLLCLAQKPEKIKKS